MIQPIITRAESRKRGGPLTSKTSLLAKDGGGSWKHTDGKFRGAGRPFPTGTATPVVVASESSVQLPAEQPASERPSVGVAAPALATACRTRTPTPPGAPAHLSSHTHTHDTPSTKPSAARLPKHAQRFRASRRQDERRFCATSTPFVLTVSLRTCVICTLGRG